MSHIVQSNKNTLSKNIVILLEKSEGSEELNYKTIMDIKDPEVARQAFQTAQLFERALISVDTDNGPSLKFDVSTAMDLVKTDNKLAVDSYTSQTISQSSASVSVMVDKIVQVLKDVLNVTLSSDAEEALTSTVSSGFTDLESQQDSAWFFWEKTEKHKTTYQYNILFAVQNTETGFFIYSLPMGMEIDVDVNKEKVLWITIHDKESYNVELQALSVVEFIEQEALMSIVGKMALQGKKENLPNLIEKSHQLFDEIQNREIRKVN